MDTVSMATNVLTHSYGCLVQLVFTTKAVYETYPKQFVMANAQPTNVVSYLPLSHIAGMVGVM